MALSLLDPSSFSQPDLAAIKHASLKLNVDFERKVLNGFVVLDFNVTQPVDNIILDVSSQEIQSIELIDGTALLYTVDSTVENFGSKLTIKLKNNAKQGSDKPYQKSKYNNILLTLSPEKLYKAVTSSQQEELCVIRSSLCTCRKKNERFNSRLKIKIKYKTSPSASALQWLDPQQTSGKQFPYLFSQCQPIHARSIMPCQDTPAVKFTYDAEVTAPPGFTVLMSALRTEADDKTTFRQPVPIASYLLAIAVGRLESRPLGPRSLVWSEKEEIDRSAWEFADTEKFLKAAERLCGPYVWRQYDLLVLPPSFPYGGMENPCLTFVTPTLLAGDRSQADVIVHEIMHSWTGNLVTNRNFEHFWLNEGFTVFLERKVAASLIEDKVQAKKSRDFHSLLGLSELKETVLTELNDSPLTKLVVDLKGVHPDDAFSTVPYEKGSLFLVYLEDIIGGPEVFDDFLRAYLNAFKEKSLDTDQFKSFLLDYYADQKKIHKRLTDVDWAKWLYNSGMPPVIPNYDTTMTKAVTALLPLKESISKKTMDTALNFSPHQMIHFLQQLLDQPPLSLGSLNHLGESLSLVSSKNSELQYRWHRLCIRSRDKSKIPQVFEFLNTQGRMKYVRPIYRDLYAWEEVRQETIDNFLKNEPYMMHVSAYTLRKDLFLRQDSEIQSGA